MYTRKFVLIAISIVLTTACIQPEARGEPSGSSESSERESESQEVLSEFELEDDELAMRRQLPDVVEAVMPSVVGITTERTVQRRAPQQRSPFGDMFPGPSPRGQQGEEQQRRDDVGSGVIVDDDGLVITNNHVIDGADAIDVVLSDGRELSTTIVGTDPDSDIAVLRIEDPPGDLSAIAFGDSDGLRLGESVIAIGNPFGLSGTVTMGIISAKGRADVGIVDYENFIQTDAAINPGNSGGALINLQGELIGINTAILTRTGGYQGVGFAIPSNMVEMVMNSLIDDGQVDRGWLGVVIQQLEPRLREALELGDDLEGVLVSDVQEGSPAAEFGVQRGDVVTEVDGREVTSPRSLRNTIGLRAPGEEVELRYVRDNEPREVTVTLGSHYDSAHRAGGREGADPGGPAIDGLELRALDSELRARRDVPESIPDGVMITEVEPGSEAARYDLREGDIILEVNRRAVADIEQFNAAYDGDRRQNLFLLYRDGTTIYLTQ